MTNLHNGHITDLLNNSMRYNPETIAVGYAIYKEKQRIMELADRTRLMSDVASLDEKVLDYLAVELRTPAYNDQFPIDIKRELIAGTLSFYTRLGTPASINWLIQTIFGEGRIEEWFQYGGKPGYFRVRSSSPALISGGIGIQEFLRILDSVKRLSAWLDAIVLEITGPPFLETPGKLIFRRWTMDWTFSHLRGGKRFDSTLDFDGKERFDQDGGGIVFQRFRAAFRFSNLKTGICFDGSSDFGGGISFNQDYDFVGFPALRIYGHKFQNQNRLSSAFIVRDTFRRQHSIRFDGSADFDGGIRFDHDLGNKVIFQNYHYGAAFVHKKGSPAPNPPAMRFCVRFREVGSRMALSSFITPAAVSEQSISAFSAFAVSEINTSRHSGALTGQITMDNWQTLDGSAKLDGTFKLNAYLKQEKV